MNRAQIILKKGKYDSLQRKHPWVFSGAVKEILGNPSDGDLVDIFGAKGEYFGFGHFQKGSICVRILSFGKGDADVDFFIGRIKQALSFRLKMGYGFSESGKGNAWRLIFGEADQLSGLIVDFYNGVAVIQPHSSGFQMNTPVITEALKHVLGSHLQAVFCKFKDTLQSDDNISDLSGLLYGELPEKLVISEYGNQFYVDVAAGQKTGFFLDQRENRKIVSEYSNEKKVLNMFCYSGGFSVSALKGGAAFVHSVDSSASAVEMAKSNLTLNGYDTDVNTCIVSDAFEYLEKIHNQYDVIILDPPAYAKHSDARHRAVKGYQRLNTLAIKQVRQGGVIFTYSCSQVVDKRLFESTVMSSAIIAGRHVRIVQELTHAPCHAHAITHPEGKYLKGLMLYVE